MSMGRIASSHNGLTTLLKLIEQRFGVSLQPGSEQHLQNVCEHYRDKRALLLREQGPAGTLQSESYAKAVLISEAARMMILREIMPRPKKKKSKRANK